MMYLHPQLHISWEAQNSARGGEREGLGEERTEEGEGVVQMARWTEYMPKDKVGREFGK